MVEIDQCFTDEGTQLRVVERASPLPGSLLQEQLAGMALHHEDVFYITLHARHLARKGAHLLLGDLLHGFLHSSPRGVSRLMAVRNLLVSPLKLRTSPLGCPASSLLSRDRSLLFDQRFPVLVQASVPGNGRAQVILGVDDKHLMFRSCVDVEILDEDQVRFSLSTRVHCKNGFGRFYMWAIALTHRMYVVPSMLRCAVAHISRVS